MLADGNKEDHKTREFKKDKKWFAITACGHWLYQNDDQLNSINEVSS